MIKKKKIRLMFVTIVALVFGWGFLTFWALPSLKRELEQLDIFKSFRDPETIIITCTMGLFIYNLIVFVFVKVNYCLGGGRLKTICSMFYSALYVVVCSLAEACVFLLFTVCLLDYLGRLVADAGLTEHSIEFVGYLLLGIVVVTIASDIAFDFVLLPTNWLLGFNRKRDYLWHNSKLFAGRCFIMGAMFTFFSVIYAIEPPEPQRNGTDWYAYASTLICAAIVFLGNPVMERMVRVIKISLTNFRMGLRAFLNRLIPSGKSKKDNQIEWKERYQERKLKERGELIETMRNGFLLSLDIKPDSVECTGNY